MASGRGRVMDVRGIYAEFPSLDPDVPLRYRRIVEQIPFPAGILEIGRGDVGLAHLLGAPMVTCDIRPVTRTAAGESFVRASGIQLPFRDASFDAVVAVDVFHITLRPLAWLGSVVDIGRTYRTVFVLRRSSSAKASPDKRG